MKKIKALVSVILSIVLFLPSTVFAQTSLKNYLIPLSNFGISNQDYYILNDRYDSSNAVFHEIIEDNKHHLSYCLDFNKGAPRDNGSITTRTDIYDMFGNKLSAGKLELLKNILTAGYQYENDVSNIKDSADAANGMLATQILVWEVVGGARSGYTDSSYTSTHTNNSLNYVKSNDLLKRKYYDYLSKAASLADENKPTSFGKTYTMHFNDSKNQYVTSKINIGSYSVSGSDSGLSVSSSNGVITVSSKDEITTSKKVSFKLTLGNTLSSTTDMRVFRFTDAGAERQELILSYYHRVPTGELSVKTESGKFKITKKDSTTNKNIKGAVFELHKCNASYSSCSKVTTIDMKNSAVSSDITVKKSGNYMLKETKVPTGYDKMADLTFTLNIDDNGKVTVKNSSVKYVKDSPILNLVLYNEQKLFNIKKVDGNGNASVKGATFQIKKADGTIVKFKKDKEGKYIYDANGTVTSLVSANLNTYSVSLLPVGEYILEETNVPSPYVLAKDEQERQTKFKIDSKNFLMTYNYSTKKYVKSSNVTITVKNYRTRIIIQKRGLKNAVVPGVVFELYDSTKTNQIPLRLENGEYIYNQGGTPVQLVTNNKGQIYINSLNTGTYYLKEISTPVDSGLIIDPDNEWTKLTVSVKRSSATAYNITKEIRNAKGTFCFYKIDEDGNYLDSGKFKLQMYNTKTSKYEDKSLIFNSDKTYKIDATNKSDLYVFSPVSGGQTCFVDVDAKGKYRIVELEAPKGFLLPSSSEAMAEIEINEYGYASGDAVIMNRKIKVGTGANAQAEFIVNIQTGQDRINYIIIISSVVLLIGILIYVNKRIDKK